MTQNTLFEEIAGSIIQEVQDVGLQSTVSMQDIMARFSDRIGQYVEDAILDAVLDREEVANAILDTDGYDVVLYTDYAPNYDSGEEE